MLNQRINYQLISAFKAKMLIMAEIGEIYIVTLAGCQRSPWRYHNILNIDIQDLKQEQASIFRR